MLKKLALVFAVAIIPFATVSCGKSCEDLCKDFDECDIEGFKVSDCEKTCKDNEKDCPDESADATDCAAGLGDICKADADDCKKENKKLAECLLK